MTYKNKFIGVVKQNGSVLRENDGYITIPFNSEYNLFLKNLDSRRSLVDITIDGVDVLGGTSIIIDGNSSTELEGFLDGNVVKNKFRFIQKTKEIMDNRGDKVDDGLIRIEFQFEKMKKIVIEEEHHHHHHHHNHHN